MYFIHYSILLAILCNHSIQIQCINSIKTRFFFIYNFFFICKNINLSATLIVEMIPGTSSMNLVFFNLYRWFTPSAVCNFVLMLTGKVWCLLLWKCTLHIPGGFWDMVLWGHSLNGRCDADWMGYKIQQFLKPCWYTL